MVWQGVRRRGDGSMAWGADEGGGCMTKAGGEGKIHSMELT